MAWARATTETAWRQTKAKKLRQMTSARIQAKRNICKTIPSQLSFSQQELIRVHCFMSGYKITDKVVGSGAYAKVYLADVNPDKMITDPEKGEIPLQEITPKVAVKVINKDLVPVGFLKRFLPRELENHSGVTLHPNIVRCFEHFSAGDHVFIVLEYCQKGDLLDLINNTISQHGKCFSRDLMRKIFRQICLGVQHLHNENIVHRDLKCENILLTDEQDAKITDFGFSCRVKSDDAILKTSCGSYAYAAPEVIQCQPYNGYKADIWSLGVILFAMANGRLPFKDGLVTDLDDQMKQQTLFFGNAVPGECAVLLRRILQYDPENRPTLDTLLKDSWLSDKNNRSVISRKNSRPKWVNSYTVEKKDDGSNLKITNTTRRSHDTPQEASTAVPDKVTAKPVNIDSEPVARPATWPCRPVIKARTARSTTRPASSMKAGYLTVEEERQRLNRTKAGLRVPGPLENIPHAPDWLQNKDRRTNGKLQTVIIPETNRETLSGTRNNKIVSLRKEHAKRVIILANIYAKPRRESLLPKHNQPKQVGSQAYPVKPVKGLPAVTSLCVSPMSGTSTPKPPTRHKGTARKRPLTKSCIARLHPVSAYKVVPAEIARVTPIIKQVFTQGRELISPSSAHFERPCGTPGCGYNQTRSSFLRCQASRAKVIYQSTGRAVLIAKSNPVMGKATLSN